jgi:hypothetical protein
MSADDDRLRQLRVLAILPPVKKDRSKYLLELMEAAKDQWQWDVSVICADVNPKPFDKLVGPTGRYYSRPAQLKVAAWEGDPEKVAEVERHIHEAECATGLPIGRCILAGSHTVGRAFNASVRYAPRYAIVRRVLSNSMESATIVRRLFRFADKLLDESRPDLIIAFEWATAIHFVIWLAAQRRGITCAALRSSKIISGHAFWTTNRLMFNETAIERAAAQRKSGAPTTDAGKAYIREFREKPRVIQYIATKWEHRMGRNFFRWHTGYVRMIVREAINTLKGQDRSLREPALGRLFRFYRATYLAFRHQNFFKILDDAALEQMKYVYFPMHKEAELALTFQATQCYDQRNTIRVLASLLPAGYKLLIREHRFNYGQRPTRVYHDLAQIPNVVLIDAFDSQFKYLRHAELVVTEVGSSGWESLLLGRRTLLLSDTFYDGAGLGVRVRDPSKFNAALLGMLGKPAVGDAVEYDRALGCMVDGELGTVFPARSERMPEALDMFAKIVGPKVGARGSEQTRKADAGQSRQRETLAT